MHSTSPGTRREQVLVDTDWAEAHLQDSQVVFIEVDEDTTAYNQGHLPGAVQLDWTTDLQDPVVRDLVSPDSFAALLGDRGITAEHTVVLYGGNNNWFSSYAYWYFRFYGHRDVRILDGGRKKWELDGRVLTQEVPDRVRSTYQVQGPDHSIRAGRDQVLAALGSHNFVDVRSPDEYAGRLLAPAHLPQEQAQRAGHIPTAINVPWSRAVNDDGTFLTDDELRDLYAEAGLDADSPTIVYCRIGERSAHSWFVLHELLGHHDVRNYDGSWTEYGSLVGVPVVLGEEPGQLAQLG